MERHRHNVGSRLAAVGRLLGLQLWRVFDHQERGQGPSGKPIAKRRACLAHAVQASTGAPTATTFARLASTSFIAARSTSFTPWPATADRSSGGSRLAPGATGAP